MKNMKNNKRTKLFLAVLMMLMCVCLLVPSYAGTSTEGSGSNISGDSYWIQKLNSLPPFKFENHKNGIGYGNCPVYSAPSEDAYRAANGKASCSTNTKMADAGFVSGWLLVRYETNNGNYRVGYIPPKYVRGFKSSMYPHFDQIPAVADDDIYVTDNPMSHIGSFAKLDYGESFYIISKYDYYKKDGYEWWYIQCTVDGKPACGFIECSEAQFHLGY